MQNDLNKIIIIGRLTRDPEIRQTNAGTSVCSFSIANNKAVKGAEAVSFFNVTAWGKLGEVVAQYMKKGNRIAIDGRLSSRTWEDTNGKRQTAVEIVAENVQFLESAKHTEPVSFAEASPFDM